MFDFCINVLRTELNNYLKLRTNTAAEKVIFANLGSLMDMAAKEVHNKLIMSLVDISQEEQLGSSINEYVPQGSSYIVKKQPIACSIYLLFSTHFKAAQALEGIGQLARVLAFFQSKSYFTIQNTPALQQADLDNIAVELVHLNYQDKKALWSTLGMPYRPSVLYKAGIIAIADTSDTFTTVPAFKELY